MPVARKTIQARRDRIGIILPILKSTYPDARCSLDYKSPLQLIVATILSAQCTDVRVNIVTKDLFKKYPSAKDFACADQNELENDIKSTGFFRSKAKSIISMARSLEEEHRGKVPKTMDELTALAGVGRKTANVVLGNAFGLNEGITVDTHVTRVANRLGLTRNVDAVKIEADLIPIVPREDWTIFSHLLIFHGRAICKAQRPLCEQCPVNHVCPSAFKIIEK